MQYVLTPYSDVMEPWVWWDNAFNEEQLNWLQIEAKKANQQAQIGDNAENKNVRRSSISWLKNTNETEWIFSKLSHVVSSLNSKFYRFDLVGFGEALQLTNYQESENGMYGWHEDFMYQLDGAVSRKLSLVLQLSDPSEYEGGNLQLHLGQEIQNVKKQRGLITVFPSFRLHQVTPVVKGSRQSLVAWISGPPFR